MKRLRPDRLAVALLALLAYVPALASSPGRMPADTKLYLYLDPGMLVRQAPFAWDTSQFGGWVPHQMISYLWPSGPFYWVLDTVGVPDWVAHRLWIGTLFFLAGWGMLLLARRLGLPLQAALIAALVYQCTPFLVPYVSRTSLMLLPWAVLGWLTVAVLHAYRTGSWRWAAVSALLIGTIGGVNGTAFLMIVPAPVLLVAWEWSHRRLQVRRVAVVTARLTVLAVAISVWWAMMLSLQGRYGAEVLSYSETLEGVSFTSTSTEVVRSMGYWLAYIRDAYAPATTAALPYMESVPLIVVSYALPLLCLLGLMVTRWRYRGFAALLFLTGTVLSVGFHPYDDPAPLLAPFRDSGLGLALRSSTRALPLVAMGLGLAAGAAVTAIRVRRPAWGRGAAIAVGVLAVVNLPSLWLANYVDPALERDQDPPQAWLDATAGLDDTSQRVLQLPGSEFGAFRWGYTVDPPLPGLMDAPLLTRDLLPLGSAGVMDLLYALDNRAQAGSLDPRSVAPVARLLGADHLWLTNDLAFERFRTPRPERFAASLSGDLDGVGPVIGYGDPQVNVPDIPMVDEETLGDPLVGTAIAPVVLRQVRDAAAMVATTRDVVVVDGSGDGVVDAAAAGWLTGREPVAYANDLSPAELDALDDALFIVTDSNRDRTLQWRGSQDTIGMTETGGPGTDGLPPDPQNQRLPLFATDDPATQTVAVFEGGSVEASAYGEPFAFLPEYRAAMAVDGDLSTAWLAGQRFPPIGETLTVSSVPGGELRLVQSQDPLQRLMITSVEVADQMGTSTHELGPESLTAPGQVIAVSASGPVTVRITAVAERPDAPRTGTYFVGFAEVGPVFPEFIRPPTTVLQRVSSATRWALVLQREYVRATNRWRADPEPALRRTFELPAATGTELEVVVRLHDRAPDAVVDALHGVEGPTSSRRLTGVPSARASGAFDGDLATAWTSPFGLGTGSTLTVDLARPSATTIGIVQPVDDRHSRITRISFTDAAGAIVADVPAPDSDGRSQVLLARPLEGSVTVAITGVAPLDTLDRRYGDQIELPVALREIEGITARTRPVEVAECRDDLLTIDGRPVGLRIDVAAVVRGEAVTAMPCDGRPLDLAAGTHRIESSPGTRTGISIDTVSLGTAADRPSSADATRAGADDIRRHSPTSWSATLDPCPDGCWVILRQGFNEGWEATVDGRSLGSPRQLDGGVNGWWLDGTDRPAEIRFDFAPQRTLRIALGVSALTALVCIGLIVWPPRRRAAVDDAIAAPRLVWPWALTSPRRARVGAALAVVAAALLVAPKWAAPALVIAAAVAWYRHARFAALAAWAGMVAFASVVALRQLQNGYAANAGWPAHFGAMHRPMMFCVVVLAVLAATLDDGDTADEP